MRPVVKREAVAHLQARMGLSERRACAIVGADRKMVRYRSRRPPDTELRQRLRVLANERRRRARRKAVGTRAPILVEVRPNARWSLDFVHDQFGCGRRFRILNVVDDVTRECLGAIPEYRCRACAWQENSAASSSSADGRA